MDMSESIMPRSDQVNSEDLLTGPRTFTITDVRQGSAEQPVFVYLAEHPQPFKPSKTVRRLMVVAWGTDSDAYIGKRMTLYRDPGVRFGGKDVGGIRVSHMSGIRKQLSIALATTRGQRGQYVVEPLPDGAPLPAKVPTPMDRLVWAFNAAKIPTEDRLDYCMNVVGHELDSAADLTDDEIGTVVESLQQAIAYEREQENQNNG